MKMIQNFKSESTFFNEALGRFVESFEGKFAGREAQRLLLERGRYATAGTWRDLGRRHREEDNALFLAMACDVIAKVWEQAEGLTLGQVGSLEAFYNEMKEEHARRYCAAQQAA